MVTGSSGDDDTVDSVSAAYFTVMASGFVSGFCVARGGSSSPKSLKYPPPGCVSRHSSLLCNCMSIRLISFLSASPGLLGSRISLSNFLSHSLRKCPGLVRSILLSTSSLVSGEFSYLLMILMISLSAPQ